MYFLKQLKTNEISSPHLAVSVFLKQANDLFIFFLSKKTQHESRTANMVTHVCGGGAPRPPQPAVWGIVWPHRRVTVTSNLIGKPQACRGVPAAHHLNKHPHREKDTRPFSEVTEEWRARGREAFAKGKCTALAYIHLYSTESSVCLRGAGPFCNQFLFVSLPIMKKTGLRTPQNGHLK